MNTATATATNCPDCLAGADHANRTGERTEASWTAPRIHACRQPVELSPVEGPARIIGPLPEGLAWMTYTEGGRAFIEFTRVERHGERFIHLLAAYCRMQRGRSAEVTLETREDGSQFLFLSSHSDSIFEGMAFASASRRPGSRWRLGNVTVYVSGGKTKKTDYYLKAANLFLTYVR